MINSSRNDKRVHIIVDDYVQLLVMRLWLLKQLILSPFTNCVLQVVDRLGLHSLGGFSPKERIIE